MNEIPFTVEEYRRKRSEYEELAIKIKDILYEIFNLEKINYALTEYRAKSIESFQSKLKNEKKGKELYDLAGIRAVGYVRTDVEKIVELIKKNFDVDEEKSKDKASELKPDQFGYRAIHLVCTLPEKRTILPEYKKFKRMFFEIQVKTILEHAWAQIEHDRNYKYKALPDDLKREFYLVSGNLEMADKHFDDISKKIEEYDKSIKQKTDEGKLEEIKLNPATLKRYLIEKFSNQLKLDPTYGHDGSGENETRELIEMGIHTLYELDKIIPKNLAEIEKEYANYAEFPHEEINLSALVFATMIVRYGAKASDVLCKTRGMSKERFEDYLERFESTLNAIKQKNKP